MSSSSESLYSAVRANVDDTGKDSRVEVNQRALIDKILARYASAGAVYRELLQNSNDAEATNAEVHFTTTDNNIVTQVMYRNNGMPFRDQDWKRLKKIAEGNPDVSKVGAFGVGAYTMFSICEEPLVISGDQALAFMWRGDALWTKTATNVDHKEADKLGPGGKPWTTFLLPSRDPYSLPSMEEFGSFLCASLTFTRCLRNIRVFVNGNERLFIQKTQIKEPTLITPPQSSSWFSNDGAVTTTSQGTFYLTNNNKSIKESIYQIDVLLDGEASSIQARYVSATAKTRISSQMAHRMERVTKKQPPKEVNVEVFLNAGGNDDNNNNGNKTKNRADKITESFSPQMGKGRIFIGFRTSQTTGLAAHLAAPFVPTVEREAIDLQDATLRIFNSELLEFSGILMRLSLEHAMSTLEVEWNETKTARDKLERELNANKFEVAKKAGPTSVTVSDNAVEAELDQAESDDTSGGLFGFAKFMAKGIKKQIVSVVNTVDKILDDGSAYLNPQDPRPLCAEERHAILLMQSFCPEQSTPDPLVGMSLANGFSRCMPNSAPPVLTRSGVCRGNLALLPNHGMESFVDNNVIRKVVYMNCEEYHDVIARCRKLKLEDVANAVAADVLPQNKLVFFINWWIRYSAMDLHGCRSLGQEVKDSIVFYADAPPGKGKSNTKEIKTLRDLLFFVEKEGLLSDPELPMPPSVLPPLLQSQIGMRTLTHDSLKDWFEAVPIEIWMDFMSQHRAITGGQPEDEKLRVKSLSIFSKEYTRKYPGERHAFGGFCKRLLSDKRCIPFDSDEPTQYAADIPSNLYLYSAELKAFEGVGSFHKCASSLKDAQVSEDFLLELGVRKSIAVEFLFQNLDTLKWSNDPKPLVEYLRTASLSSKDVNMLRQTQYLPAENDESRTFAPSELFLPDPDLRLFPFVRLLQWPSEDGLSVLSPNGKFLAALGCHEKPSLDTVLHFTSERVKDDETRIKCLDFLSKRLGPHGVYQQDYSRLPYGRRSKYKIIPCMRLNFLQPNSESPELCSPVEAYSDVRCGIMCYPVIDPKLESRELYGTIFQCPQSPGPDALLEQLLVLVKLAKKTADTVEGKTKIELSDRIMKTFTLIFHYLSGKVDSFDNSSLSSLKRVSFIPIQNEENMVEWYRPDQVFFKSSNGEADSFTELLFKAIEFSSFLSAVGVKEEASARDLFVLLIQSPQDILDTLGEKKYRLLLRRLAANPPFARVSPQIRAAPFLLAYTGFGDGDDSKEKQNFKLARAEEIYIIDNSFFGRMFPVLRAPHESDLEEFYTLIGSKFISKEVQKRYEIVGRAARSTKLVKALRERIDERTPLLVSPHVTSRPLVKNAASILDDEKLSLFEADGLLAVFSLGKSERRQRTTCCARPLDKKKNAMYVTKDLDFFDVGQSIGDLILERCQLEDAFFISSLLEAPLEQLRSRGFAVDRVIKPKPLPEEASKPKARPKPPPPPPPPTPPPQPGQIPSSQAPSQSQGDDTTSSGAAGAPEDGEAILEAGKSTSKDPGGSPDEAFSSEEIMKSAKDIFPNLDEKYIRDFLGSSPSFSDIQRLAEHMSLQDDSEKNEPSATSQQQQTESRPDRDGENTHDEVTKKGRGGLKKSLGRAFGNLRRGSQAADIPGTGGLQAGPATEPSSNTGPVSPQHDAVAHRNMESMLANAAARSAPVDSKGHKSPDTLLTSVPKELDRGSTCEVVPGQSLKPFSGPRGDGRTHNGIRVFSARNSPESEPFLHSNEDAIEKFALVIMRLCGVYDIDPKAVAIFHDPRGGTIAFNANRSIHFNVRFFYALHYLQNKHESYDCYAYWMVVFAHELAHNLVSGHNKEHGFYTESYISKYLPKFLVLMSDLPRNF